MALNSMANDAMIRRLEKELDERNTFIQALVTGAQEQNRDINENESQLITDARNRIVVLNNQLDQLEETAKLAGDVQSRMRVVDRAIVDARTQLSKSPIEYATAGAWVMDSWQAAIGERSAKERIEIYERTAEHQKTADNLGVVPDPIVGSVLNFIDDRRPLVTAIGPQGLPAATFYRPVITQQPAVAVQGSAGAAGDEKTELTSQKMTLTRKQVNATTYGGYVNVSRQNIDFSQPSIMDIVIQGLASQYAIETEAALCAEIAGTGTDPVVYDLGSTVAETQFAIAAAIWQAVKAVYETTKGQGRLVLVAAPDVAANVGPLFPPVNPQNAQSAGLSAGSFGQGPLGSISGVTGIMSAGLASGEAFLLSTAAVECFEQRIGALQVAEPSLLGVQVAYAGYFSTLTVDEGGIVPIWSGGS